MQQNKRIPPQGLPRVSMQTWYKIFCEWNSEEKSTTFIANLIKRLEVENPEIAKFFGRIFERFKDKAYPLKAMFVYACSIYHMVEVETQGQLPLVSADIGGPLQTEFLRDPKGFYLKAALDIEQKNPNVLESVLLLTIWYQLADDDESASWIPFFGVVLYKMLGGQLESDELSRTLAL